MLIPWDKKTPRRRPAAKEIIPIIKVSKNNIRDIFLLLMPNVK